MKYRLLAASAISIALTGCATQPQLAPQLAMPSIPSPTTDLIEVKVLVTDGKDLTEGAIQHPTHKVSPNSSVVINVPEGLFEDKSTNVANGQDFKTKDFFNEAEQQIERELIRSGFHVLSRSKFEAKLRSLRDESRCDYSEYRCLHSMTAPELQPILENLQKSFENGKISASNYASQIKEFREKLKTGSAGRTRNGTERELTDISEVIRAAESGDIRSDYILQINIFDTEQQRRIKQDLLHNADVRSFLRTHPAIADEFKRGNNVISCATTQSQLNAKLVHVKTGEIAWIGEHSLNEYSAGVQSIGIELGSKRYVSNSNRIRSFVYTNNTPRAREARFGKEVKIPEFEYAESLVKPTVSSGRCSNEWNVDSDTKVKLARQVAKELISTIKINY